MNLTHLKKLYFLGIGGIGMSALARYFLGRGVEIHGYDIANTGLTKKLEAEGIHIHYDDDHTKIPKDIDGVILTPAIPEDFGELVWLRSNGYVIKKRAEVLGEISKTMHSIAIAGTHGKTTTSSVLAHILKYCGLDITAFLGGILVKEESNFISGQSGHVVLEADEYDRSFLHLYPDILVILSMDADHLDIYHDLSEMEQAYEALTLQVKPGGLMILAGDVRDRFSDSWQAEMKARKIKIIELEKDFGFDKMEIKYARFNFDFHGSLIELNGVVSFLPGRHNLINTSVALEIASQLGAKKECLKEAVEDFKGIKRRFQWLLEGEHVLIDDYAHHPNELKYAIETAKSLYPGEKIMGIFQPHLYSRTADFYREFADELSKLDEIWLMPIYPAREKPMAGVQSEMIYNLITNDQKYIVEADKLIEKLEKECTAKVILTLGASDIDKYHQRMISVIDK